jgi:hypothetical protein
LVSRESPWYSQAVAVGSAMLWLAPALVLTAIIVHVASIPAWEEGTAASPALQKRIGEEARAKEPASRRKALERFPGSPWSAADDFGNREEDLVRRFSNEEGVRPGAVLDAIDRDVKAFPGRGERGRVAACMPRPFYD